MGRRLGVALVVVVGVCVFAPANAYAADAGTAWIRPVSGALVRPFDPPTSRFGAGHLGADLAAPKGMLVRAAGPGIVSFSGSVAKSLHVVVAHAGNLRTSYSFLATIAVRRGDSVVAGQVVGTAGGAGQGHAGSVLHFALRTGDIYVDPMVLFRPVDLVAVVHLSPTSDAPHPAASLSERRGLIAGFMRGVGAVSSALGKGAMRAARVTIHLASAHDPLIAAAVRVAAASARGTAAYLAQHCDPHAPPANGEGGSGHRVMVVAGIDSTLTDSNHPLALPTRLLGYHDDEVTYFSYAKDGGDYDQVDTEGPLLIAARRLGDQLRAMQRTEPGREVDLIAHSQGGVIVEAFLMLIYEAGDSSYPPIGRVVTLSSPLRGDPIASAVADVRKTGLGTTMTNAADLLQGGTHKLGPRSASAAVRDLAHDSPFMKRLERAKWPRGVQLTAIGAATDFMVPGNAASRPGAQSATVIPRSPFAHQGILTDPTALRNVRAALEGKPLPCRSLANEIEGEVLPAVIGGAEDGVGAVAAAASQAVGVTP
jgi:triacylglycerol esterase/lipase EstA (alpha/beta hydrolase family)